MATCRQIITASLRKARQIGSGESPAPDEAADALVCLQSLYDELVAEGKFGRLTDVLTAADYTAGENQRVANEIGSNVSISLPETVTDADSGETRSPRDLAVVVIRGDPLQTFLYSAARGAWDDLKALTFDSYAPLSERSQDGLSALLAVRMVEEFGGQAGPAMQRAAASFLSTLAHKRDSPGLPVQAAYY